MEATIDLEGLRLVRDAVLANVPERFAIFPWRCETSCCGIGAFSIANPGDALECNPIPRLRGTMLLGFSAIAERFGISTVDAFLLFGISSPAPKGHYTRDQFLARLEKFIAYHTPEQPARPACEKRHAEASAELSGVAFEERERMAFDEANVCERHDGGPL